ncbi:MAG TPA: hypothetical protein ENN81_05560 [Phycisphaerales bacterium]|nr:hypothetical protein [Phycisphaerales bacterium]
MLKYRLIFGTLMVVAFVALVLGDGLLDGRFAGPSGQGIRGTLFSLLLVLLVVAAQWEFAHLAAARGLRVFLPVTVGASIALALTWYVLQVLSIPGHVYVLAVSTAAILGVFLYQQRVCGLAAVMANCGVSLLSVAYCGVLAAFALAIRIDFGIWAVLMYVFVVKSSDIGAYAIGRLFGRHKFSPRISPGKTWEGMVGAVAVAVVVAVVFVGCCDIIAIGWPVAVLFGAGFAFIGQMGDLAESMLKRDAARKDSAAAVPGFGGVLDIVDSPLVAAPFAYLFFSLVM